ncbi:aminoglycoside phosphotransferase family protein [Desertihabitans aurantiacus]|uniref:aminoglycoside phosphotransferase family protein n=1 Tax=Desertihabitans aurantiacus TaxID=2282477 RepID=UPI001E36ACB8|nr:aminoglycoside phosphotransferase family protein [Desertihabitans aurantiacus]
MTLPLPPALDRRREGAPEWVDWLDRLPSLRDRVLAEWQLDVDGEQVPGSVALVVPVRDADGQPAVLKLAFDGAPELEHEALALQHWHGDGTVRLLRADPRRRALLLERLGHDDLTDLWDLEACEIVAGFYRRLHRPAMPQLRTLTSFVDGWLDDLAALGRELPVPPRLVEQALHQGRALVGDPASAGVVIHGDLHYGNVLAAEREPWLVIDPQPMDGDPHWEPAPLLTDRWEEMAGDLRAAIRRRFHTVVDVAELDEARARDWTVVRMVVDASWAALDARRAGRGLTAEERDWITRCVAVAKAVQD